jgi:type I restriction enzyme S subunit
MTRTLEHKKGGALSPAKGYKKTDFGWIPEDWGVIEFGEIADKNIRWSITGGPFGSDLKAEHYTDEGVRIIQLQNIGDGKFNNNYQIYTSEKKANELLGCNIYPGDLILSKMGDPVTRTCLIPDIHNRYVMGSDGIRLVPDKEKFDKTFVLSFINYSLFRKIAIAHSTGSTRQRIGLVDLKKLPFICPPLPEQQKIAAILSTWDKGIDTLNKLISEKEQLKKGLMQQLLTGKKRFAGFTEEWSRKMFTEICELIHGYQFRSNDFIKTSDGIKVVKIGNVGNGEFHTADCDMIAPSREQEFERFKIVNGDILMSLTGNIGRVVRVENVREILLQNYRVGKFVPHKNIDASFLTYVLSSPRTTFQLELLSNQAAQANFGKQDFNKVKVDVPSFLEQQRIAAVLSAADKEIALLRQELTNLTDQKKGLMQKLLTGEVRVKISVK